MDPGEGQSKLARTALVGCLALAILAAAVAGVASVILARPGRARVAALDEELAALKRRIQRGLILEARFVELRKQRRSIEKELAILHRKLPPEDELARFPAVVAGLADAAGVTIALEEAQRIQRDDGVVSVERAARVCGPAASAEALLGALCGDAPLASVHDVAPEGDCVAARIVVYGRTWQEREPEPEPGCDASAGPEPAGLLLLPFRGRIDDRRRKILEACMELRRLQVIVREAGTLEASEAEVERRRAAIRTIASSTATAWCHPAE